ncbi:tyrosine-type recombinase/integrase [Sulfurimonas sp. C5]|uniref:tyrosine-type recombinase/integrase n=1 Tax=Sulfurimonas sp. C5 TaxID=3036947 RepID=UPI0024538A52|nr:tyrosine-type recombinase/integrase [Sulfurimonas sp. C5]MDH4945202.1 tyrosine-type recombinase/integrase [Sulfurimonas sp. C5]
MKKLIAKQKEKFLEHLTSYKGYSNLTVKTYKEALDEALEIIEIVKEGKHILFNLMPYRIHISELKSKTISKKLSAIRSFSDYLNESGIKVVLKADESVKVAKTLPKPIAHKHIIEALQHADLQEKLIITILYTMGLRISELSHLELKDIDSQWIRVIGKGSKQRDIPVLETTRKLLQEYLEIFSPKKFLFEKNGEKLSENSLRYIINKVFARISLKVTPHQLRHSYATSLLNGGAPIVDVSELLGHSSMATTQIYTKLGSALKKQNYDKAHPLCGVKQ